MDFNTISGLTTFIEERDFRLKVLEEKKLFPYLCSKIMKNGKPITPRTARKAFVIEKFEDLKLNNLAVWLESETLLKSILREQETYAGK